MVDEISNPTGGEVIRRLKTAPDGRLWVFTTPGTLLAQTAVSPTAILQKMKSGFTKSSFDEQNYAGIASLGGFFPSNGNTVILSPTILASKSGKMVTKNTEIQASISPASVQDICTDYGVNLGQTLQPNLLGSFPASDGTRYVVGNDGVTSTIYLRGKPDAKGVCNLNQVTTTSASVLQAWKQTNGDFLAQIVLGQASNGLISSEIAVVHGGTIVRLVSTKPDDKPARLAGTCCDIISDWSRDQSLVTHMGTGGDGGHAFLYKNNVIVPVYDNDGEGLINDRVFGYDINGDWVVIGGISLMTRTGFSLILINVPMGRRWILETNDPGGASMDHPLGNHIPNAVTVGPDGTVYFAVSDFPGKIFRATIPGVTGFMPAPTITSFTVDNPTIVAGGSAKISWVVDGATSCALDQGIGTVPCTGTAATVTISPTVTTPYTLTATGPGGITPSAPLIVTVTPKQVSPPSIKAITTLFGGATSMKAAPGEIVTLWGNLCANVPANTQWIPLQTAVAGCSVKFTDVQGNTSLGNLYFVSAGQINVQVPSTLALGANQMVVTFNGLTSSTPMFFQAIATNPDYVVHEIGSQTYLKGIHADGSVTGANPAEGGEMILVFLSGLGAGTKIAIDVNGVPATVYYAGTTEWSGLEQINVRIPDSIQYATEFTITATATDGTQKVDTLLTEPPVL